MSTKNKSRLFFKIRRLFEYFEMQVSKRLQVTRLSEYFEMLVIWGLQVTRLSKYSDMQLMYLVTLAWPIL